METPSCSGAGRRSEQLHDSRRRALPEDEGADKHGDHPPGLQEAPAKSTNSGQHALFWRFAQTSQTHIENL